MIMTIIIIIISVIHMGAISLDAPGLKFGEGRVPKVDEMGATLS